MPSDLDQAVPQYEHGFELCGWCQQLFMHNTWDVKRTRIPTDGIAILTYRVIFGSEQSDSCPSCLFLWPRLNGHLANLHWPFLQLFTTRRGTLNEPVCLVTVGHGFSLPKFEHFRDGCIFFLPASRNHADPSPLHHIQPTITNYDVFNTWIADCRSSHELCNHHEKVTLPYLILIDCSNRTLVRTSPTEPYLALSYVWGEQPVEPAGGTTTSAPGSFEGLPKTINDAILLTIKLGRKYLWVDRSCINQDDDAEKELMIRHMDEIYANAEATIVALEGESDAAGLPGVSSQVRTLQPRFKMRSGELLATWPPIATIVKNSKWATRGWTYQEARLSRRCLFFTSYQVYFVCHESTFSEDIPSDAPHYEIGGLANKATLASIHGTYGGLNYLLADRYFYSKRQLTYPERDSLDAFRGILARSTFVTIFGVPIKRRTSKMNPNDGLALGLLWSSSISSHGSDAGPTNVRRPGFPTWSWTSINGEVGNERGWDGLDPDQMAPEGGAVVSEPSTLGGRYFGLGEDISLSNEANICFWLYDDLDEPVELKQWCGSKQTKASLMLPELSNKLLVEGFVVKVEVLRYPTTEIISESLSSSELFPPETEPTLGFNFCDEDGIPLPVTAAEAHPHGLNIELSSRALMDLESPTRFPVQAQRRSPGVNYSSLPKQQRIRAASDALLLIQWSDSQPGNMRRVKLMLLEWVGEDVAERRGILSEYSDEWNFEELDKLPKTRRRFVLQ